MKAISSYLFLLYLQVEEVKAWFEERLKPSKVNNLGKVTCDYNQFVSCDYSFGFPVNLQNNI